MKSEEKARQTIDRLLTAAGWSVQDVARADLHAARGVALREFPLSPGHGIADYLLYLDGKAAGVIEAKKEGATLTGVEIQSGRYAVGLPTALPAWMRPLPFLHESTGLETHFTNALDPEPRARNVFAFHRSGTLADWLRAVPRRRWSCRGPRTLRRRAREGFQLRQEHRCIDLGSRVSRRRPTRSDFGVGLVLYRALYAAGVAPSPHYRLDQYDLDFAVIDGDRRVIIEVDGERYRRDWTGELCLRDRLRHQHQRLMELEWEVKRFWVYEIRDRIDQRVAMAADWVEEAKRAS